MAGEKNFENKIKKYLKEQGCYFIKYWGGGQFTKSGVPDIIACCNGFFLAIEVKGEKGTPSELQLYNLKEIDEAGGYGVLLYPKMWKDFKDLLNNLSHGHLWYKENLELQEKWKQKLMKEGD